MQGHIGLAHPIAGFGSRVHLHRLGAAQKAAMLFVDESRLRTPYFADEPRPGSTEVTEPCVEVELEGEIEENRKIVLRPAADKTAPPPGCVWNAAARRYAQVHSRVPVSYDWLKTSKRPDRNCWICRKRIQSFKNFEKCSGMRASAWTVPGQVSWPIRCGYWQCKNFAECVSRSPAAQELMLSLDGLRCQGCDRTFHEC